MVIFPNKITVVDDLIQTFVLLHDRFVANLYKEIITMKTVKCKCLISPLSAIYVWHKKLTVIIYVFYNV